MINMMGFTLPTKANGILNMNFYIERSEKQMDRLEEFLNAAFSNEGSDNEYDDCWYNGNYTDQYCPCCPHANECSCGSDD